MRKSVVLALAALPPACGGRSEGDCEDCRPTLERLSSRDALAAIRAQAPGASMVMEIRANPAGSLDAAGRDVRWLVRLEERDAEIAWSGVVSAGEPSPAVTLERAGYRNCQGSGLADVDSAGAVPQALSRIEELDLEPETSSLPYYWEQAPCLAQDPDQSEAPSGHLVRVERRHATAGEHFFAHFDDQAELIALCGPCDSNLQHLCVNCTP